MCPHSLNQNIGTTVEGLSGTDGHLLENQVNQVGKCIPEGFLGKCVTANFLGKIVLNPEVGLSAVKLCQTIGLFCELFIGKLPKLDTNNISNSASNSREKVNDSVTKFGFDVVSAEFSWRMA